jgi:hemerythrin
MQYKWDDSLTTGQTKIDDQHKQLFAAVNNLIQVVEEGKGEAEIKKSLDFLTDYTIKHFFEEEAIQTQYKYPDFENHHKYHEDFKASVKNMSHELILKGSSKELVDKLCNHFAKWLIDHIMIQDKKLAAYIKQEG